MKNKKGFISISIIYSFFIVFLLILVLIMSTYMNNRYSFNIYTKDIKRNHADTTRIVTNNAKAIEYLDSDKQGYYSYYYVNNSSLINYYYYTKNAYNNTEEMNDGQVFNFYIYLGESSNHALNDTVFFNNTKTHIKAIQGTTLTETDNKIIIIPSLNFKYISWNEAMQSPEGIIEVTQTLINSVGNQLVKTNVGETFKDTCTDKGCTINVKYIGYEDGADGVIRLLSNPNYSNTYTSAKYYVINSGIICNSTKCDLTTAEETTIKDRTGTAGVLTGYGKDESETKNYKTRMNDLKTKIPLDNYTINDLTDASQTIANIINS